MKDRRQRKKEGKKQGIKERKETMAERRQGKNQGKKQGTKERKKEGNRNQRCANLTEKSVQSGL